MTHQRKVIRDAVVALLDTGAIVAAGKVYSNRGINIPDSALPVINLYTSSETSAVFELCTTKLDRALSLEIEAVTKTTDETTLDDALDALAEGIETAMNASASFNGTAFDSFLSATALDVERQGESYIGRARLTYDVRYHY